LYQKDLQKAPASTESRNQNQRFVYLLDCLHAE
jgi:hypothetical protein